MAYVDFDSLVISYRNIDIDKLKDVMNHFKSFGVRNFIITYDVDLEKDFIATILHNLKNIKADVKRINPFGTKVYIAPTIFWDSNAAYNDASKRLLFKRTNKLFIQLPKFYYAFREDNFFKSTNHLLYKLKYTPIFTRFEDALVDYPPEISKKIFKTRRAAFCVDINYLSKPMGTVQIFSAMNSNSEILLIPSISGDLKDYPSPELIFGDLKKRYSRDTYLKYCHFMNNSIREIFPSR